MEKKHWLVFLEANENEGEDFYFYFEKNDNNIAAFEVIKELIADDEECQVEPEFVGTEEEIERFPDRNSYMKKHNIVKWDLDIEKLKTIESYSYDFYKGAIVDFLKKE